MIRSPSGSLGVIGHEDDVERVGGIIRMIHKQREVITQQTLTEVISHRPMFSNVHLLIRILSYMEGVEIVRSVFPVCKTLLSLQFNPVLWRLAYNNGSPLKYGNKLNELSDILFAQLGKTGFGIHELEERERFADLFVVQNTVGYYRCVTFAESPRNWAILGVTNSVAAFAYAVGREIAHRINGVFGSLSECFSLLWNRFFSVTPLVSCIGHRAKGRLCQDPDCSGGHIREEHLKCLLLGAIVSLELGQHSIEVTVEGCSASVLWCEPVHPNISVEPASPNGKLTARQKSLQQFTIRANVIYYTKTLNFFDTLLAENAAGPSTMKKHLESLLSGASNGLRRTPAELRRVQCCFCREVVSSYDFAIGHAMNRCGGNHVPIQSSHGYVEPRGILKKASMLRSGSFESSFRTPQFPSPSESIGTSSHISTPVTPVVSTPRGFRHVIDSEASAAAVKKDFEQQLKERRQRFFNSPNEITCVAAE